MLLVKVPTSLLRERITIEPYEGSGAYGPTYGTPVTVKARVEGKRRAIRTSGGVDVISSASATIRPDVTVAPESKVTHEGRSYEVLDVLIGEGLSGPAYFELVLGGAR